MKHERGLGGVFQPTCRDAQGELKTSATFWLQYYVRGKRYRESALTQSRAVAVKLLKSRLADSSSGKPFGHDIERTTLGALAGMIEAPIARPTDEAGVPYAPRWLTSCAISVPMPGPSI
jgi:hypothetical protein